MAGRLTFGDPTAFHSAFPPPAGADNRPFSTTPVGSYGNTSIYADNVVDVLNTGRAVLGIAGFGDTGRAIIGVSAIGAGLIVPKLSLGSFGTDTADRLKYIYFTFHSSQYARITVSLRSLGTASGRVEVDADHRE